MMEQVKKKMDEREKERENMTWKEQLAYFNPKNIHVPDPPDPLTPAMKDVIELRANRVSTEHDLPITPESSEPSDMSSQEESDSDLSNQIQPALPEAQKITKECPPAKKKSIKERKISTDKKIEILQKQIAETSRTIEILSPPKLPPKRVKRVKKEEWIVATIDDAFEAKEPSIERTARPMQEHEVVVNRAPIEIIKIPKNIIQSPKTFQQESSLIPTGLKPVKAKRGRKSDKIEQKQEVPVLQAPKESSIDPKSPKARSRSPSKRVRRISAKLKEALGDKVLETPTPLVDPKVIVPSSAMTLQDNERVLPATQTAKLSKVKPKQNKRSRKSAKLKLENSEKVLEPPAPTVNSTVIEPSIDQTPIPLLEHLTPDLSKAKARKSRSPKKKSAKIQDISTQPLASNGANSLQEHQVTTETEVKSAKVKKSRKKSAKHQEAPSEVLPESPAQSVSSNGAKPAKIKKSRKKSAKHQEAPAEVLPESPAQSVSSNGVKPAKIKKSRKKSAKHQEAPAEVLPEVPQIQTVPKKAKKHRKTAKHKHQADSIDQPCSIEIQQDLPETASKILIPFESQQVQKPEVLPEAPRNCLKAEKITEKPEEPCEKVVREPKALFDESFDRPDEIDESILHQVDQVIQQQELVVDSFDYHDVIKPYQVVEKEPVKYYDYDYSDDDVVEPELQVPSALFEYKSDTDNELEEDEVIIPRFPVSRPTYTYSRISRYEDFESGFKSPVSPCQAQSLDPFEFTDDEDEFPKYTPMKSPMKSPFRNFCAVNASIVPNLQNVKDEFASDDIMDTVENIEPPIVPPLVIKTKIPPLGITAKLPPLVITSEPAYVNKTCGIKRRISIQNDVSPIRNFGSPLGSPAEKQQLQPPKKKARRGSVKKARSKSQERPPSSAQRKSNGRGKSHSKNQTVIKKEHLAPAEVPNLVEPLNEALAADDTTNNSSIKTGESC